MIRITSVWVLGIVTLVPYAVYRLLFVAQPAEYAFLIVFPLFWIAATRLAPARWDDARALTDEAGTP